MLPTSTGTLRERQAQQTRTAILDAAVEGLTQTDAADLSMSDIAEASGISLRTLYRFFPDRTSLLEAAGEFLYASLGVPFEISEPDDIAASFRDAARRLSSRPKLARALVQGGAGRTTRSRVRNRRLDAIRAAVAPITENIDPKLARRAGAVIAHLCSATSWVSIADESRISDSESQEAVAWAIDALVQSLRQEARRAKRSQGRPFTKEEDFDHE